MKLDRFRGEPETPLFPLTAMIDVLFLMIIFLVLGANFDSVVSVELPQASGGGVGDAVIRVELPSGGGLRLNGGLMDDRLLDEKAAVQALRRLSPQSILLLPHRDLSVNELFRWYDLLGKALDVPVSVGVRPPQPR